MINSHFRGATIAPRSRITLTLAVLTAGALIAGCADIHPAPNDPDVGLEDVPGDDSERLRENFERADEHGREQQEENRR